MRPSLYWHVSPSRAVATVTGGRPWVESGIGNPDFHQLFHRLLSTFRLANVAFLLEFCERTSLQTLNPSELCQSGMDQQALTPCSASVTFVAAWLRYLGSRSSLTPPFVPRFPLHPRPFSRQLRLYQLWQQLLSRRHWPDWRIISSFNGWSSRCQWDLLGRHLESQPSLVFATWW